MTHKGTVKLETERLILRRFSPDDSVAMFNNLHTKAGDTVEAVCDFFCKNWVESYNSLNSYQWVIVLKSLDEPIGTLRADMVDDLRRSLELGYEIGEKWWHQGIMTETVERVIKFFFGEVGLNRISARHNTTNPRSDGVMLNVCMSLEGILRQASRTGCDVILYAILAEDYLSVQRM
jgi:ribosomal-protein-alanine N-acetyltransferase